MAITFNSFGDMLKHEDEVFSAFGWQVKRQKIESQPVNASEKEVEAHSVRMDAIHKKYFPEEEAQSERQEQTKEEGE